jgi:myo-inositol 2-dehydrogenase/D-chiro-inositol 1-dehydrogenase
VRPITIGVLGAGRIGQVHGNNLLRMPGVKLKTVTDPYVDFSSWPPSGVATGEDPALILDDDEIEAVLVCSPTPTHADLTERAARAGKHVFCEKPIDLDPERIRRTLAVVAESRVKLQVGFNRRFDPTFARVRRAVTDGEVGAIHLVKITSRDPEAPPVAYVRTSGGIFLDMTIHDFDMVRFLTGSEVEEVYARGAVLIDPAIGEAGDVDTAVTTLKMASGDRGDREQSSSGIRLRPEGRGLRLGRQCRGGQRDRQPGHAEHRRRRPLRQTPVLLPRALSGVLRRRARGVFLQHPRRRRAAGRRR